MRGGRGGWHTGLRNGVDLRDDVIGGDGDVARGEVLVGVNLDEGVAAAAVEGARADLAGDAAEQLNDLRLGGRLDDVHSQGLAVELERRLHLSCACQALLSGILLEECYYNHPW